ncbi:beta-lactamase family protein [bacterium]|nr:beta-lactamase family protein [bacterium]
MSVKIDALFKDFDRPNMPGAVVMVIREGKVIYEKGYGFANIEQQIPCTTSTNFRLASVSKQFTAMAILILAERKQLWFDDPITKFFPEFPSYGNEITVLHLLSHRSGLIDYEDLIPDGTTIQLTDRNVLNLVRQQNKTYFPPDSEFRYSNTGYALLSLIVEAVSGNTYAEFLKRNIFSPLQMTNTIAYEAGISKVPNRSYGYVQENNRFTPSDQSLTSAVLGDGGIYTSVNDLFKWDQALYADKILSQKMLKEALTVTSPTTDIENSGYGFGWYITKHRDTDLFFHRGHTCGFTNLIERYPEKKFTVVILTNRRDAKILDLGKRIFDLYF